MTTQITIPLADTYIQTSKGIKKAKLTGKEPKPSYWKPNFNDIYSGKLTGIMRAIRIKALGLILATAIELSDLDKAKLGQKVSVSLEVCIGFNQAKLDIFNLGTIYLKVFEDTLTKLGYIPDDNKHTMEESGHSQYRWIDEAEEPYLVFTVNYK
jgi:hypothetical protein